MNQNRASFLRNHWPEIPDPVELLEARIERQEDLIDWSDMSYPCCECGKRFPIEEMLPVSASPSAALICRPCLEAGAKAHRVHIERLVLGKGREQAAELLQLDRLRTDEMLELVIEEQNREAEDA